MFGTKYLGFFPFLPFDKLILLRLDLFLIGSCDAVEVSLSPPINFFFIIPLPGVSLQLAHRYPSKFTSNNFYYHDFCFVMILLVSVNSGNLKICDENDNILF